jgi:hypothetical protein
MKKIEEHICKECGTYHITGETIICDTCGEKLNIGIPIIISFGYGNDLDGEEYHFDKLECLFRFVVKEALKK